MLPLNHIRLNLRVLLLLTVVFAGRLCAADRPNILFIYTDDQNYKTVSCYEGAPDWVKTPNIDDLARRGIRFHRAYFGAWCMPSRASFLTGHLQHGIQTMRMEGQYPGGKYDPTQCPFWPSVLRKHGYHTAQIGKWHTGNDTGYGRDWDYQAVWNRPGHPENAGHYFYDQIVTINGKDEAVKGYSTDNYTSWAVDYINGKNRNEEKPWYLWLCYGAVHGPTTPADRHEGKLAGNTAPLPESITGPWPNKPAFLEKTYAWVRDENGTVVRRQRKVAKSNFNTNTAGQTYDDWVQQTNECAMAIDEGVGRVMEALRASGQLENTLVVFTADQGFSLGQHGLNSKIAAYDAAIASPLIISHAGVIAENKFCKHPVNAPDIVRWFCDVTNIALPWKTHGRDIRPLIRDPETTDWNEPMLMTHTGRKYGDATHPLPADEQGPMYEVGGIPWYVLLREGRFKYVRHLIEGETEELYDLDADPEELTNLSNRVDHKELLVKLREKAVAELRRTDAKFADHMPPTAAMKSPALLK